MNTVADLLQDIHDENARRLVEHELRLVAVEERLAAQGRRLDAMEKAVDKAFAPEEPGLIVCTTCGAWRHDGSYCPVRAGATPIN